MLIDKLPSNSSLNKQYPSLDSHREINWQQVPQAFPSPTEDFRVQCRFSLIRLAKKIIWTVVEIWEL
ncbi:uncharacterized protein PHALS_09753 [Plasmopara halstedii]|uniref:Uncharacterized protein n=1 Tax=Plasmopara halstedii TaxID=4781 RepID=A0A0P1AEM1_PLAHL|nr:uncharacterized protein PHALS_09753 [Plasmopara halstedii]CEG39510.1 hypothetical protein PHALS_09753 [Plasmopara halstedii]|eukprot:XP_024575879.1 hypothetical protein PHALS_09753 [Plasmopara halstedii]